MLRADQQTVQLIPGDLHPHAPGPADELAERLGVEGTDVEHWIADGLPVLADGRLDPFEVTNWLSWGRLDRCPVLARRWRAWLRWFSTPARGCRLVVRRSQTCYLPAPGALRWLVPEPPDAPGQCVLARQWTDGEATPAGRLIEYPLALEHRWACEDEISLSPVEMQVVDRSELESLIRDLAGTFTYAYRQHLPEDTAAVERSSGTCLDLALLCGARLSQRGRPWRLVSGVVAHRALSNPHFWIEVDGGAAGWIPLDPTIPAVGRMLGADWTALVSLAVGRHDGRRIRVAHADGPIGVDLGGSAGRLDSDGDPALYCSDWAIGSCSWSIAAA